MTIDTALIIGCGSIGYRHGKNLESLGVDVDACDIAYNRALELAHEVDGNAFRSVDVGLSSDPDVVVVCTPSNHHLRPARKAAIAGCDLFVEKPLSNTSADVRELVRLVEDRDLVTMVGCNMRFHPAIKKIAELLENGAVGKPISARIEGGSYLPEWRPEEDYREMYSAKEGVGGAILDYIHELNYGRWFFGEPERVSALLGSNSSLDIQTEDTASVIAEFSSGAIIQFHLDYIQRDYSRSCHVIGETGTIKWDWNDRAVRLYDADVNEWTTSTQHLDWAINDMYIEMMEHFLECIKTGAQPTSTLRDGWQDLKFAMGAKESHISNKHIII